jgi:hypothetical protein
MYTVVRDIRQPQDDVDPAAGVLASVAAPVPA